MLQALSQSLKISSFKSKFGFLSDSMRQDSFQSESIETLESPNMRNEILGIILTNLKQFEESSEENEKFKMSESIQCMPECAEKTLLLLKAYFYQSRKNPNYLILPEQTQLIVRHLRAQLRNESLLNGTLKEMLDKIEIAIPQKTASGQLTCMYQTNLLISEVRPLDIDLLLQLLQGNFEACDQISDQDIILLLGESGAGKSLTVHFLAGSTIQKDEQVGLKVLTSNPQLDSFATSHSTHSVTRCINSISVACGADETVIVCDTPGFNDTDGAEYDIANGICIADAMRKCHSIKPVILLSQKGMGDRCQGISNLSKLLVKIFSSIEEHAQTFTYVFTKFQKEQEAEICRILESVCDDVNVSAGDVDEQYVALLTKMIDDTKTNGVFVLDPLQDLPQHLLDVIKKKKAIVDPKESVHHFVTPKSMETLSLQLEKDNSNIKSALLRLDFNVFKYKLQQLQQLNIHLPTQKTKHIFQEAIEQVKKMLEKCQTQLSLSCRKVVDASILNEKDSENVRDVAITLFKLEKLRSDCSLDESVFGANSLSEIVVMAIRNMCASMKLKTEQSFNLQMFQDASSLELPVLVTVGATLNKLSSLFLSFSRFEHQSADFLSKNYSLLISILQESYHNISSFLVLVLKSEIREASSFCEKIKMSAIESIDLDVFVLRMSFVHQSTTAFSSHQTILNCDVAQLYLDVQSTVLSICKEVAQEVCTLFSQVTAQGSCSSQDIDGAVIFMEQLSKIANHNFQGHLCPEPIQACCSESYNSASCLLRFLLQTLEQQVQGQQPFLIDFSRIENLVSMTLAFFKNTTLRLDFNENYLKIINLIHKSLHSNAEFLIQVLPYDQNQHASPLSSYKVCWQNLQSATQLSHTFEEISSQLNAQVIEKAQSLLESFEQKLISNSLALNIRPIKLQEILREMEWISQTHDWLGLPYQKVQAMFMEGVMQGLMLVFELVSSEISISTDYSQLRDAFTFFHSIQSFHHSLIMPASEEVSKSKLTLPSQLTEQLENIEQACITLQQQFESIFLLSMNEKFQSLSELRIPEEEARTIIFDIVKSVETLKQIQQLHSNTEVFPGITGGIFETIFSEKPNEITLKWCEKNGLLENHFKLLFSRSETTSADTLYLLRDNSKWCIDFDHLFQCEPIEHKYGRILNFKDLVLYLNLKLDKYVGGIMSSLKCYIASNNFEDFHKTLSSTESSQLEENIEYSEVLNILQGEILAQLGKADENLKKISFLLQTMNIDSVNSMLGTIRNLEQAEIFCLRYLNEQSRSVISSKLFQTKLNLQEAMHLCIQTVDDYLERNKFYAAEETLFFCRAVAELSGDISLPLRSGSDCNILETVLLKDFMLHILKTKDQGLKSKVISVIESFRCLEVQKYGATPPSDIFIEFRRAEKFDAKYSDYYKLLAEEIRSQVTQMLKEDSCIHCDGYVSLDELERRVVVIESLSKNLPSDVVAMFADTLASRKSSIQKVFEITNSDAKNLSDSDHLQMMIQKHRSFSRNTEFTQANIFSSYIRASMYANSNLFESELEKGDFINVLRGPFPVLWVHWWGFSNFASRTYRSCGMCSCLDTSVQNNLFSEVDVDSGNLCSRLVRIFASKLQATIKALLMVSENNQESIKILCCELPKILCFVETKNRSMLFYCGVSQQFADCANLIFLCLERSAEYLLARQELFEAAMRSKNFNLIAIVLSDAQQLEVLYAALQIYEKSQLSQEFPAKFKSALEKPLQYNVIQQSVQKKLEQYFSLVTKPFESDPRAFNVNAVQRIGFYKELSDNFLLLIQASKVPALLDHMNSAMGYLVDVDETCRKQFHEQLSMLESRIVSRINNIGNSIDNYTEFSTWLSSLDSMLETFEDSRVIDTAKLIKVKVDDCFSTLLTFMETQTLELINRYDAENKTIDTKSQILEALVDQFITLKDMSIHIPVYKRALNSVIDRSMDHVEKKPRSVYLIANISLALKNDGRPTAKAVFNEAKAFEGYALELRNNKTQNFSIEDVLREIRGDNIRATKLKQLYGSFDIEYWNYVDTYMVAQPKKKSQILAHIKSDARVSAKKLTAKPASKSPNYVEVGTKLMACLFAYWTLAHYQKTSILADSDKNKVKHLLLKPHATQVVAIFRMLGMDNPKKLSSNLVQMLTGEGKSVILAVASSILALMGYDVYCACYSDYLSTRDYNAFESIFQAFDIADFITYGTFSQLCENYINRGGSVRDIVLAAIAGSSSQKRLTPSLRPKILLLDEVDVFFSEDFHGSSYRPAACLKDPVLTTLIKDIWNQRENEQMQSLSSIKETSQYADCLTKFVGLEEFLEKAVKNMLDDLRYVVCGRHKDYEVERDQIGYKAHDGITFNTSYGYMTLFTYFKEHSLGRISQESLERQIALHIVCGVFSYAYIPKEYACVVGVTGTLETFVEHPVMQSIQNDYGISQTTYIPSAFGNNMCTFSALKICEKDSFNQNLTDEIKCSLGSAGTYQRAVLVFFENTAKLTDCLNSESVQGLSGGKIRTMTELDSINYVTREGTIGQATLSGNITFLVRAFGRGTDFICYDNELNDAGGIHVIQTFMSEEKSEEVQIKGRTARQGDKGSFSMILCDNELVNKFHISSETLHAETNMQDLYNELDQKRSELIAKEWTDPEKKAAYEAKQQKLRVQHENSMSFLYKLLNDRNTDLSFLIGVLTQCTFPA